MDRVLTITSVWDSLHENRWLYWLPLIAYAGLIFYLSSLTHPEKEFPSWFGQANDKFMHLVEYGVLGILAYRALRWAAGPRCASRAFWLAILFATLYGISDEIHQVFVPPRSVDPFDVVADAFGATMAVFAWRRVTEPQTVLSAQS